MERSAKDLRQSASFDAFVSSSCSLALKESFIGGPLPSHLVAPVKANSAKFHSPHTVHMEGKERSGSHELIRIPSEQLVITKEKSKPAAKDTAVRGSSKGPSAQTSGRTTPVLMRGSRSLSEAAVKVNASLKSHNDRFGEDAEKDLISVFNAEYNVTPNSAPPVMDWTDSSNIHSEMTATGHRPQVRSSMEVSHQVPVYSSSPPVTNSSGSPPVSFNSSSSLNHGRSPAVSPGPDLTTQLSMNSPYETYSVTPINWTTYQKPHMNASTVNSETTQDISSDARVSSLLLKNAQLEGQLEMLTAEVELAMKERTQYLTEVGALKSKLQFLAQGSTAKLSVHSEDQLLQVQKLANELQRRNTDTQQQLEQKVLESQRLTENLASVKEINAKLQSTVSAFVLQMKDSETALLSSKVKLKSIEAKYEELTSTSQASIDRIAALQDDVTSLTETKDWYQKQLHAAQETRNLLQTELTRLQNLVSSQADNLERLKVENAQSKHQLSDTQQKALTEKQMLIRHLEAIEADMLEREAGFEQIEKEKGMNELSWQQRLHQIEKDRTSLSKMVTQSSDLDRQLQKTKHDLEAKTAAVDLLESQQRELHNRLVTSQDALERKERELDMMREKLVEAESTLSKVQKQDRERGSTLQTLKQEKAALQIALNAAVDEKKAFSQAVDTLKTNTSKVEVNYKKLKQELLEAATALSSAKEENERLNVQLYSAKQDVVSKSEAKERLMLEELQRENMLLKENFSRVRLDLEDSQHMGESLSVEKKTLEQQVMSLKSNAAELELITQRAYAEKQAVEQRLQEALGKVKELTKNRAMDERVQQQNASLQQKLELTQEMLHKAEVPLSERIVDHERAMAIISQQLVDAIAERDVARRDLQRHEENSQLAASQQNENLYAQIQMLRTQQQAMQIAKDDLEREVAQQRSSVQVLIQDHQIRLEQSAKSLALCREELLQERADCQASIARHKAESETNKQLHMELERERGRLSAVKEQLARLKQHSADLDTALAQRESSLVQLSSANMAAISKQDRVIEEQKLKIRQLDLDMNNQSEMCTSLQHELNEEKRAYEELVESHSKLKLDMEWLQQEHDKSSLALVAAQSELVSITELCEKQNANISMLNKEYRSAKIEMEQQKRSAAESSARNPIITDELQALQWQVKQKAQESLDALNHLKLCEQRSAIETENLKRVLTEANKELDSLKLELDTVRKDKFTYQSRVAMLRSALKGLLDESKTVTSGAHSDATNYTIDTTKYEELLKETAAPGYKSKPLENLKSCLSGLHSEISVLQQQMVDHKNALKTNSDSWRVVETEVADLEKLVTASRQATKVKLKQTTADTQNV